MWRFELFKWVSTPVCAYLLCTGLWSGNPVRAEPRCISPEKDFVNTASKARELLNQAQNKFNVADFASASALADEGLRIIYNRYATENMSDDTGQILIYSEVVHREKGVRAAVSIKLSILNTRLLSLDKKAGLCDSREACC